jgi:hypothetical protein
MLATPMYDAFTSAPVNAEPFTALPETTDLLARNSSTAFARRMNAGLDDFTDLDAVPQHTFDNVLWKYVHGPSSIPPPPETTGRTPPSATTDTAGRRRRLPGHCIVTGSSPLHDPIADQQRRQSRP